MEVFDAMQEILRDDKEAFFMRMSMEERIITMMNSSYEMQRSWMKTLRDGHDEKPADN